MNLTNTDKLYREWDKIHDHLSYDLSHVSKVFIDTFHEKYDGALALHYRQDNSSVIVVHPKLFTYGNTWSNYTDFKYSGDECLRAVLLHEICHVLQVSNQIETSENFEVEADEFANKHIKAMR